MPGDLCNISIEPYYEVVFFAAYLFNQLLPCHACWSCKICRNILVNCHTSSKVLYNGTGASLITLGSRQSTITPARASSSNTCLPCCNINIETWLPRSSSWRGVINLITGSDCWPLSSFRKNHNN